MVVVAVARMLTDLVPRLRRRAAICAPRGAAICLRVLGAVSVERVCEVEVGRAFSALTNYIRSHGHPAGGVPRCHRRIVEGIKGTFEITSSGTNEMKGRDQVAYLCSAEVLG